LVCYNSDSLITELHEEGPLINLIPHLSEGPDTLGKGVTEAVAAMLPSDFYVCCSETQMLPFKLFRFSDPDEIQTEQFKKQCSLGLECLPKN